jgi:hypothetical protein
VRFIGGGQYRAEAAFGRVWKCAPGTPRRPDENRPETTAFRRAGSEGEEISTAVDEPVEYSNKRL